MSATVSASTDTRFTDATTGDGYDWRLAADVDLVREIRASRCRLDAQQLRLFANAYATAERRTARASLAPADRVGLSNRGDEFAWQLRSIMGEFAVATRASDTALCNRAHDAHELLSLFPTWVDEIDAAVIELAHADSMLRKLGGVPRDRYDEYGARVFDYAKTHTPGQTRTFAGKVAAELAADEFEAAHEQARAERRVYLEHAQFGMSWIHALLPTEQAVAIEQLLTDQGHILKEDARRARADAADAARLADRNSGDDGRGTCGFTPDGGSACGGSSDSGCTCAGSSDGRCTCTGTRDGGRACAGMCDGRNTGGGNVDGGNTGDGGNSAASDFVPDDRTIDQMRADLFADTLLTATPEQILNSPNEGAPRVVTTVSVVIPVTSLLEAETEVQEGVRRDPALLNGMIPISTKEALQVASTAPTIYRILTDPITGHELTVDDRQANAQLRRVLKIRDKTCRFPGCVRPAQRCELDHTVAYSEGGPSSQWNLAHLCKGHHVQKHHRGWRVRQLGGGVLEWTSPLGQVATTVPERVGPVFRPSQELEDPPPF